MRFLLSIFLLCLSARSLAANPDDAAWLIYDVSYGDYFLLRVEMKTSKTGHANVAGGNRYAGRRFTDQYSRFDVAMLGGQMRVNKEGAKPFMVGTINSRGDEFAGEFLREDGSSAGRFVGALQGFTTHQMDLFQLCKQGDDRFRCVNRGRDQRCDSGSYSEKSTFFTEENCRDASDIYAGGIRAGKSFLDPVDEPERKFSEDPTGTWLFYDDEYEEHVVARIVATNMDQRGPGGNIRGTFVFSGVYYGWDKKELIFGNKRLYFGRRYVGVTSTDDPDRDTFVIDERTNEIALIHGPFSVLFGEVDLSGGRMAGSFSLDPQAVNRLTNRDNNSYRDFGTGKWTAEKKSDDPNFDFPLYQVCASKRDIEDFRNHACKKVSDVRADGSNRPQCAIGYSSGQITFLSEDKCTQLVKEKRNETSARK